MVSLDKQFFCSGNVTEWRYQGKVSKAFKAIVWKRVYGYTFQIVGINNIPAEDPNKLITHTVPINERITVKPGYMMGWSSRDPVLTYSKGGGNRVARLRVNTHDSLEVNQIFVRDKFRQRAYSIAATVGKYIHLFVDF